MKRRLVWLGIVLVIGGAVAAWFLTRPAPEPKKRFESIAASRGSITAKVTATGTVSPLVTVSVGTQVSGRIQQLFVDFNSTVHKGDVVAKIDPLLFQASVDQTRANEFAARANVAKAQAQERDAARQAARAKELVKGKYVAQADVDTAQANAEVARSQIGAAKGALEQARAARRQAEVNLAYTTILSPIDGTVISRTVDVGQTVASALQAPTLFTIAEDLRKMQVHCNVAEGDVGRLQPGMAASFTVDAYPSEKFPGVIHEVRNSPQTVQNVVTYDAVIDVENPDQKLKPGMTANVTVVVAEKTDILRVPNSALRFKPPVEFPWTPKGEAKNGKKADSRLLYVLRDEEPVPVRIRIGITDNQFTEVAEGELKDGEALVTEWLDEPKKDKNAMFRRGL